MQESISNQSISKKLWYKSPLGVLILLCIWPFALSFWIWKKDWSEKTRIGLIAGMWLFIIFFGGFYSLSIESYKKGYKAGQQVVKQVIPTTHLLPTVIASSTQLPSETPQPTQNIEITQETKKTDVFKLQELFTQMENVGSDNSAYLSLDDGHIQAIRQSDKSWVITKIVNNWPEIMADFGVKSMSYSFIKEIYHSGYPIKQAGISITAPKHIGKYYRTFLGKNQADTLKEEDWIMGPTNFRNWLIDISTSRNELDRANATFIEDNL